MFCGRVRLPEFSYFFLSDGDIDDETFPNFEIVNRYCTSIPTAPNSLEPMGLWYPQ